MKIEKTAFTLALSLIFITFGAMAAPDEPESQTTICLKSDPPRCFLQIEGYKLGSEIMMINGKPVKRCRRQILFRRNSKTLYHRISLFF